MSKIYNTDPQYIKFLDCNPALNRHIFFQTCNVDIKEGMNILSQVSLCNTQLEALGNTELGGCGGSLHMKITIPTLSNYTLTAPEIGQAQGEVQMIVVKVSYDEEQDATDQYLTWEYKGNIYPLGSLMILSGRTEPDIPWHGWDLSYYNPYPPSPEPSPNIFPPVTAPDLSFGGIMFTNPSDLYKVDLEIFIFN